MTPAEIQARLAEITAREQAATPGPWLTPEQAGDADHAPAIVPDSLEEKDADGDPIYCRPILDHEGCDLWPWSREEDMKFAYAARLDVPFLLKLVEQLTAELSPTSWPDTA